jgi:hypothetical protein
MARRGNRRLGVRTSTRDFVLKDRKSVFELLYALHCGEHNDGERETGYTHSLGIGSGRHGCGCNPKEVESLLAWRLSRVVKF